MVINLQSVVFHLITVSSFNSLSREATWYRQNSCSCHRNKGAFPKP